MRSASYIYIGVQSWNGYDFFNISQSLVWQVSDEDEFDDGYGSDLMGDEDDRANLMAMNELQREMILAERAEKRDLDRERLRNAKLLRQHQQASQQVGHLVISLAWCHTFSALLTLLLINVPTPSSSLCPAF